MKLDYTVGDLIVAVPAEKCLYPAQHEMFEHPEETPDMVGKIYRAKAIDVYDNTLVVNIGCPDFVYCAYCFKKLQRSNVDIFSLAIKSREEELV